MTNEKTAQVTSGARVVITDTQARALVTSGAVVTVNP